MSNNSIETSIGLIEQYSVAARDGMKQGNRPQPVLIAEVLVPTARITSETTNSYVTDPEELAAIRKRAAILARGEGSANPSRPNILKRDEEIKSLGTKLAIAGTALTLLGVIGWVGYEARQWVDDKFDPTNTSTGTSANP